MRSAVKIIFLFPVLMILIYSTGFSQEVSGTGIQTTNEYSLYNKMVVRRLNIEFNDCQWCKASLKNLASDLIGLHEGEPFTEELFRQSLDDLMLSKRFEEVIPEIERIEDGIKVTFHLTPLWEVKDVKVHSEYPLFKSEILKAMSVYPGDALLPDMLSEQETRLRDLYKKEGYINPEIIATADKNPHEGSVIINVYVNAGAYYSLDSLKINGNHAITDTEIKSRMTTWRSSLFLGDSGHFRETDLNSDIKEITSLYWQRKYPECEIHQTFKKDEKTGKVKVEISISEGPRYVLAFSGNKRFWAYTLKKDIPIFKEGNRRDRGIRQGIKNIKERYKNDGYLFTDVELLEEKITMKNTKVRKLDLSITEGPRTLVDSLRFSGNTFFNEEELKKDMRTGKAGVFGDKIFNPDVLEEDLAAIRARYLKQGYNAVSLTPELTWSKDKTGVSIVVKVSEGVRTLVTSIKIEGLKTIPEKRALQVLQLKVGKPFMNDLIKAGEVTLSDLISEKGHPYVSVKGEAVLSKDSQEAAVSYHVDEGRYVTMGNIYYRGNFKTGTSAIRKELGIEPGQPFSLKAMLEGQKNIRDMSVFNSVQFKTIGIKENRDRITLLIDMEEIEPYYMQAGAGYASDKGLYGNARVGDKNLFGLNKDAWLGGEVSQIGYRGEFDVTQHRIFNTPISSTYVLSYERQEEINQIFGTSVWTSSLNFSREYKPHVTTSLGFKYEYRDQYLKNSSESIPPEDADLYKPRGVLVTTPFISYDTRDSFVRPKEGFYSSYSVDISKGYQDSLDNFLKHYLNLRYYFSPVQRVTLAWLGRLGAIYTFKKHSQIPDDQLFYLGGTMDVRGYDENMLRYDANGNPVGGCLSMNGSMEARIELTHEWETALFYDTGAVRRTFVDAGSDEFRASVGIGLRYITPIGPMGLLYGYKLNRKDGESPGKINFSVGYTF
jgi:outer membrane protein insertion porin family